MTIRSLVTALPSSGMYEPTSQDVSFPSSDPLCDINGHSPLPETCLQFKEEEDMEMGVHPTISWPGDGPPPSTAQLPGEKDHKAPAWLGGSLPTELKAIGKASGRLHPGRKESHSSAGKPVWNGRTPQSTSAPLGSVCNLTGVP